MFPFDFPLASTCFRDLWRLYPLESLEFYFKFMIKQNNSEWETVIEEYRQILLSLRKTLLSMKRTYVLKVHFHSFSFNVLFFLLPYSADAHQCLLKLLSTFKEYNGEYKNYAIECGK